MIAAEQDMLSALKARKSFLSQQLLEKRELLNEICLREAVCSFLKFFKHFLKYDDVKATTKPEQNIIITYYSVLI